MTEQEQLNGISYWEWKMCRFCKHELCRTTAQAKATILIGQGPAKDYLSCMKGFEMAIQLGERNIIKEFRKKGIPKIKTETELIGSK